MVHQGVYYSKKWDSAWAFFSISKVSQGWLFYLFQVTFFSTSSHLAEHRVIGLYSISNYLTCFLRGDGIDIEMF